MRLPSILLAQQPDLDNVSSGNFSQIQSGSLDGHLVNSMKSGLWLFCKAETTKKANLCAQEIL